MGRWWRYKWITFHPSLTQMKVIDSSELPEYVKDGWLDHPSKLLPVEADDVKPRKGRKPKAVSDADKD
ncbi:hypothetical protein HH286_00035 [Salmonella enterica subsp. enterica serovar Minnesota]|nr:hypothetical protein [Salmonella enterica subsp. enterica serovar Minnesota]MCR6016335.1 hypothetical protein [Salmonella enterica subsp. enterica serovar Minnesota]